jgi:hypothetical protein
MALVTSTELEAVTNDYFLMDGKEAVDLFFKTSYALNYFLKQHKGIWERPEGGRRIRIPFEFDYGIAASYAKGDTMSSDMKETVNAAFFDWKHYYGSASFYRIDQLENSGSYAQVQLVTQKLANAQKTLTRKLSLDFYNDAGANANEFSGILAAADPSSATVAYGGILYSDIVASDGTYPWNGRRTTTSTPITLNIIRTLRTTAKLRDGADGKIDLILTTPQIFDKINDILQLQQRFTESKKVVDAGFTGIRFEGCDIVEDDFCPKNGTTSGHLVGINSKYFGFAVHPDGYFSRTKWEKIPESADDKTMKIYFDGETVSNNRQAHNVYTVVTT